MTNPKPINLKEESNKLTLLKNRTALSTTEEKRDAFLNLSTYGNGAIYLGRFIGSSDWERHTHGDELVQIVKGSTLFSIQLQGKVEQHHVSEGEIFIVPQNTWHKFETSEELVVMTITPQPTDHSVELPN